MQTLTEYEYLDRDLTKKVANFQYRPNALLGVHVASKEPPKYAAAEWDPDMNRAYDINIGFEETRDIFNQLRDIRAGRLSKVGFNAWCNTLFDESQAPPSHTGFRGPHEKGWMIGPTTIGLFPLF